MKLSMSRLVAFLAFLFVALPANATELHVVGQATVAGALPALAARFEKRSGDKVVLQLGNPGVTRDRIKAMPNADIVILAAPVHERLVQEDLLTDTARVVLGQSKLGMAVSAKAKKPPAFRNKIDFIAFLRRAKTIGLVDPKGGSGTSPPFMKAIEELGIASEIAPKYRYIPGAGENVAEAIARGEVETGATAISELVPNKGVKVVGAVPPDVLVFGSPTAAYLGPHAANPDEARKFLRFLATPEATKAFRAIGLAAPSRDLKGAAVDGEAARDGTQLALDLRAIELLDRAGREIFHRGKMHELDQLVAIAARRRAIDRRDVAVAGVGILEGEAREFDPGERGAAIRLLALRRLACAAGSDDGGVVADPD
jgi:ABC-type molybdate transport system substrate-binding protein